jgi:hypothetical protein
MGFKWSQFYHWKRSLASALVRNEVNEFGFTPLTLDFEAFVRFIRQVSWKPVTF